MLQLGSILACLFLASLDLIEALTPGKIPVSISIGAFIAFIYVDCFTYLYEQEISLFYEHGDLPNIDMGVCGENSNSDEKNINDGGQVVGNRQNLDEACVNGWVDENRLHWMVFTVGAVFGAFVSALLWIFDGIFWVFDKK